VLCREEAKIKKTFVIMAMLFFMVGIVLAAFSIQESYVEENILDRWDGIGSSTQGWINPEDLGFSWTLEMQEGSFFELNVSASDTVGVRIGTPTYDGDTGEEVLTNPMFDHVGTCFTQKVAVGESGIYRMEIKNEGTTPVSIWGNVFAKKIVVIYQSVFPYLSVGTSVILGGLASLIYGALTKSKEKHSKRKTSASFEFFSRLLDPCFKFLRL
jgi:hypothetical protein